MASIFSDNALDQEITHKLLFGEDIAATDLNNCLREVAIAEPPASRQFWEMTAASPGIYLVLRGKVRLLDTSDDLIATLTAGATFGEATLFSDIYFHAYAARAAEGLQLAYLEGEILQDIFKKYPSVGNRLLQRAEIWDWFVAYQKKETQQPTHVPTILKALTRCQRQELKTGAVPAGIFNDGICLVQTGQLQHPDGRILTSGDILASNTETEWQVLQPSVIYCLPYTSGQTDIPDWQQLATEIEERPILENHAKKSINNYSQRKIIPFPQKQLATPNKSAKPSKQRPYFPGPKVKLKHWWERLTKQYPFYSQQSASDCGAACLVMIGNYWGKRFSVNRLRDMTNVNRSGASLAALATAAESLGFACRPVKASLDKLAEQSLPAIAHWEGKHFIVVYEITPKRVIVGDPAIGQRTLTPKQFQAGWSGYALLLQATILLKNAKDESASFWKFFELVKPHYRVLLEVFMASVLIQVFGLVTPVFTQLLLDRVLVQRSIPTLNAVGLGMIVFGLFSVAMSGVRQYLLDHTANRISVSLLVGFIKHTFRLPLSYFESRYVGDIVSRIQENQKIQRFLTGETLSIVLDLLTLVIYLAVMFYYSWRMALFVLFTVPPFFILALASTNILRRISREIFNAGTEENSYLIESLTGIRTVRSLSIEQTVRWHWEELLNRFVKKSFNAQVIGNRLQIISGVIQTFVNTSLLWFGAWQVIQGQLTIGQLVAFNMLVGNVLNPFQRLSLLWNQLQEIVISTERINDVLEAEPEEDLHHKPRKSLPRIDGHIRFDNVTFRYHPESETNVLENINFEIQPDQMVAVVGRSGSGKTTLSKLILGLYPTTDGKVLIDGQDVNSISLRSLRSQIGVVDQDTFLFGGTIRENISIAHPEASLEEIIQAAKFAGADEFIQQLPMAYESQIGEGGGMLSGGQRQRLAIARALLGNPRLLLFDEATSHLDSESERIIQNNLKTILKGRTSVIIAHRLSTVRNADLILVLDKGVLVESGTHDELIAKKSHYYYLNQQQLSQTV